MHLSIIFIVLVIIGVDTITCQSYDDDNRCKCVCPNPATALNGTVDVERKLYLYKANVPPNKCNCDGVILPKVAAELNGREQEFCPRCICKYETRNTTIIKVVVTLILWVLTSLIAYMAFMMCLNTLVKRRRVVKAYQDINSFESRSLLNAQENEF